MKIWLPLLAFALCTATAESPATFPRLPEVHGVTFAGVPVSLPGAAHGKPIVLVIGFTQASRDAVALWGKWLFQEKGLGADYYEMPVLAGVPKLLRGYVTGKIKASIPEPARPHFLPLLDQESEWRQAARYAAPDEAYVLVTDGSWRLRWLIHGPPTEQARQALTKAVLNP